MLEFSGTGIDEIASRVGYIDIDAFRRVFRKITALPHPTIAGASHGSAVQKPA
jgi:transcriptional regulator GlxA family with amidase domain